MTAPHSLPALPGKEISGSKTAGFHLGYRPGLDGVRAVAILLVLATHFELFGDNMGVLAVNAFFVLSGFLITCLLIQEWDQTGVISLKSFYWRRALRLLPALLAVVIVFVGYSWIADAREAALGNTRSAAAAMFYCANWVQVFGGARENLFGHTWSLSVEEQFYLLWPLALLMLLRKVERKSLLYWLLLAAGLSELTRVVMVAAVDTDYWRLSRGLDTRADSLLLGCFAGALLSSNLLPKGRWMARLLQVISPLAAAAVFFMGSRVHVFSPWMYTVGWLLASVCSALVIVQLVSTQSSPLHLLLESPPMVYIGKISYGLYLWHYPILRILEDRNWPGGKLAALGITVGATLLSYYLIERPCLRLKQRFEKAK